MKKFFLILIIPVLALCLFACNPKAEKVEISFELGNLIAEDVHTSKWCLKDKQGEELASISLEGGEVTLEDGISYMLKNEAYTLIVEILPQYSGEDLAVSYNNSTLTPTEYKRAEHQYRYEFTSTGSEACTIKISGLAASKARMLDISLPEPGFAKRDADSNNLSTTTDYEFSVQYFLNDEWTDVTESNNDIRVAYNSQVVFKVTFGNSLDYVEGAMLLYTMAEIYGNNTKLFSFLEGGEEETVGQAKTYTFTATFDILKMEIYVD